MTLEPGTPDVRYREPRPLRLAVVAALLTIGGLLGWGAASLGTLFDSGAAPTADLSGGSPLSISSVTPSLTSRVTWTQASVVPPIPTGLSYAGFSSAVELGDTIYLVVNYSGRSVVSTRSELWSSTDGVTWEADGLAIGEPATAVNLALFGNSLLLTVTTEAGLELWRSASDRAIDGAPWTRIPVTMPAVVSVQSGVTAVNRANEIVTLMIGNFDIADSILEPYLPVGIEPDDPHFRYQGDEFLYGLDGSETIQILAEPPEVFVDDGNAWIRLVTLGNEEVLQILPLPEGGYPLNANPTLASIPIAMMWRSENGTDFLPVTEPNALPPGYFSPEAWGDGFVAPVCKRPYSFATDADETLWSSHSGSAWQPDNFQPPHQCTPFCLAVSGDRIHLTGEEGTQCIRDVDGEWSILDEPSAAAYVVGGGAGFIGYPDSFKYDKALFSHDGVSWADITIPAIQPYPTLLVLKDRVMALSAHQPGEDLPTQIDIWVGTIES